MAWAERGQTARERRFGPLPRWGAVRGVLLARALSVSLVNSRPSCLQRTMQLAAARRSCPWGAHGRDTSVKRAVNGLK